jgi:hypothetical protein
MGQESSVQIRVALAVAPSSFDLLLASGSFGEGNEAVVKVCFGSRCSSRILRAIDCTPTEILVEGYE